ncbi:MAG: hypothetical protein LBN42_01250 [Oscillospiraceae bacterium]|jgi:hypothetical protein|nr:hypothetical protein [Oscillospiraceae bacterium]
MKLQFGVVVIAAIFGAFIGTAGTVALFKLLAVFLPFVVVLIALFGLVFGVYVGFVNTVKTFRRLGKLR